MRPHRLSIESFGAFARRQILDFDVCDRLFLITGPTGSGKTTLFDAIMFALYGKLPGTREEKNAKSTHASLEAEPRVTLEFSIRGERFKVIRIAGHLRPAKRKSKDKDKGSADTLLQEQKVELYTWVQGREQEGEQGNWKPLPGTRSKIDSILCEALHLTAEEFSRIILLPQGEFQRFLESETGEKRKLLEKIFPTDIHSRISLQIKEKTNSLRREMEMKAEQLGRVLERFNPEAYAALDSQFHAGLLDLQARREEARQIIKKRTIESAKGDELDKQFTELEKLKHAVAESDLLKEEFDRRELGLQKAAQALLVLPWVEAYRSRKSEWEEAKKQIRENLLERDRCLIALERAREAACGLPIFEAEILALRAEFAKLEILLPKETALVENRKEHVNLSSQYRLTADLLDQDRKSLALLVNELDERRRSLIARQEKNDVNEALQSKYLQALEAHRRANEKAKEQEVLKVATEKEFATRLELDKVRRTLEVNLAEEKNLRCLQQAALAANLSLGLKEGVACPVCGSLSHPHPARHSSNPFTEEEKLEAASANVLHAQKAISRLEEILAGEKLKKAQAAIRLEDFELPLLPGDSPDPIQTLAALQNLKEEMEADRKIRAGLKEERDALEALAVQEKELNSALEARKEETANKRQVLAVLDKEIKTLTGELAGYDDVSGTMNAAKDRLRTCLTRQEALRKEAAEAEKAWENTLTRTQNSEARGRETRAAAEETANKLASALAENGFTHPDEVLESALTPERMDVLRAGLETYKNERKALQGALTGKIRSLENQSKPDLEGLRAAERQAEEESNRLDTQWEAAQERLRTLRCAKDEYEGLMREIAEGGEKSRHLVELSRLLNGDNPLGLSFQNYVLGAYLREVTRYASKRLNSMSEGRYTLLVGDDRDDNRKQSGLELEVLDAYTGTCRSVKSLSGGEKFQASIALALGLAEVIQARAGAIELDALFIDEGFGSLDDGALDRALGILDELRETRMVGVISHVHELRNRIPSQIRVHKGMHGSTLSQI